MTLWTWPFTSPGMLGRILDQAPTTALHVWSDLVVGLALFSTPFAYATLLRRRPEMPFRKIGWLFVAILVTRGAALCLPILGWWIPLRRLEDGFAVAVALLAVITLALLWRLIHAVAARPSGGELTRLNAALAAKIAEQSETAVRLRVSEARVRLANMRLERGVAERTAELERTVAERGAALVQRDLLLREVYHRVKNNLQIVDSLLVMQSRALTDPAARAGLRGLRARIFALGLVHNQLMGSDNLQTFDIAPFLQELSANLSRAGAGDIDLTVHAEPLDVGLDFAIPLGLLVTELVTNALKHAFPAGSGEIRVVLSPADDGGLSLVVADNGCGYALAQTTQNAGLGGRIIRGLVDQLGGVMTVAREGGTQCHVRLPRPPPLEALA